MVTSDFIQRWSKALYSHEYTAYSFILQKDNAIYKYKNCIKILLETLFRIKEIKKEDEELPADFDNEIHKWALECGYKNI